MTAMAFVQQFKSFWQNPRVDDLPNLLHDDVTLIQAILRPMQGIQAGQAGFQRLFNWIPDLHAELDHWTVKENHVFLELRLIGTLAGQTVEWPVVDYFILEGEKAIHRVSYFDTLPLVIRICKSPSAILDFLRFRFS